MIAIIDYGCGNLFSLSSSLESLGIECKITSDKTEIENADKIILVHNHPGGVAAPSKNDLETTSEIKSLLRGIGVALADHIIIGKRTRVIRFL